ncbi:putative snurportin-1-like, partial [Apostichopus japonicus]
SEYPHFVLSFLCFCEGRLGWYTLSTQQTHYTTGSTPLVGWLKPWMLPEVLRVSVPQKYIDSKPPEEPWKPPNVPSEMECSLTQESTNGKQTEEHAG